MTQTQKILLWGFIGLVGIGVITGGIIFLRNRDGSPGPALGGLQTGGKPAAGEKTEFTAEELKEREASAQLQKSLPPSIEDAWTPEFRAKFEAEERAAAQKRAAPNP